MSDLLKDEDMLKMERAFFENLHVLPWEYGAPGLDPKRPFGNSDVEGDILQDILGATPEGDDGDGPCWSSGQREYAAALYGNIIPWLQRKYLEPEGWVSVNANINPMAIATALSDHLKDVPEGEWLVMSVPLCRKGGSLYFDQIELKRASCAPEVSVGQDAPTASKPNSQTAVVQDEPEGWVSVPLEPTKEMCIAGDDALQQCKDWNTSSDMDGNRSEYMTVDSDAPAMIYKAMLAAKPSRG